MKSVGKWMELENVILCEVTQTQKDMYGLYSLRINISYKGQNNHATFQTQRNWVIRRA